ncbi:MAG: hypothetical protein VKJ04_11885 [Vampirovibrionales bacterium]|nr:hypothetical protein [Vampirovibrionales bacterium]
MTTTATSFTYQPDFQARFGRGGGGAEASTHVASSFMEDFFGIAGKWAGRMGIGKGIDGSINGGQPSKIDPTRALSYADILGLSENRPGAENWRQLAPSRIKAHIQSGNIANGGAILTEGHVNGSKLTAGRYFKDTIGRNNFKEFLSLKETPGTALSKGLGLGILGFGVAKDTYNGYQAARASNGDNDLAVAGSTALAFGGSALKAGIAWEVSNILYDIGRTTLPKMTLGRVPIGGILMGALGAAATVHLLDKVIPKPQAPKQSVSPNESYEHTYRAVHEAISQGPLNPAQSSLVQAASTGGSAAGNPFHGNGSQAPNFI